MRLSSISKPISSPGRTEKFPPPLMRFLRSNVGSRSSRVRSTRKTPLFMRRKKALPSSSAIETTQEPTSPKVTCIGQVRVRRSKSKRNPIKKPNDNDCNNSNGCSCYCSCFRKPSFCKFHLCSSNVRKWVLFFNCRSVKVRTDSSKYGSSRFEQEREVVDGEEIIIRERRVSISLETMTMTAETTTPPKNALLLTRCRSAPYRSSSLACRFWGSPLRAEEEEEEAENRASGLELSRDSTSSESRGDRDSEGRRSSSTSLKKDFGICAQVKDPNSSTTSTTNATNANELNGKLKDGMVRSIHCSQGDNVNDGVAKPLMMLMRCKSEPARRDSRKLDPTSAEFWRHRRSGNAESSTSHSHAVD